MLSVYLMGEMELLTDNGVKIVTNGFPVIKITWKGSKAELQEQIFSWDSAETFGKIPLMQLSDYIQNIFNNQLNRNPSRSLDDLRIRLPPTPFLDKLKDALVRTYETKKVKGYLYTLYQMF